MAVSFRARLLLTFLILIGLVMLVSTTAVLNVVDRTAVSNAERELQVAQRVFETLLAANSQQLQDRTVLLAEDFGFRQAIATNEESTIVSALVNHGDRVEADLIVMMDIDGEVLISTHELGSNESYLIEQIQQSDQALIETIVAEEVPFQLVLVPVRAPELIAWVGVGFEMDAALVENFKQITGADVTLLYRGDAPSFTQVLSTMPVEKGFIHEQPIEFGVALDAFTQTLAAQEWLNRDHPLFERSTQKMSLVLSVSLVEATKAYDGLQAQMLTVSILVLGLGFIVAIFISTSITKPIGQLALAARRIAAGDYEATPSVSGTNEFSVLGATLTQMQADIKEREARILYQAEHDIPTGLPNRQKLAMLLNERMKNNSRPFTVFLLKISNFDSLNDMYGMALVERVLNVASTRLYACLKPTSTLGLVGPDEWLVFAECDSQEAIALAGQKFERVFKEPFHLDRIELSLLVDVGAVVCPEDADSFEDAMRRSHIALAASRSRNLAFLRYEQGLEDFYLRQLLVTQRLQYAIQNEGFTLVFQPQYHCTKQRIHSAEALIRWYDDELGQVFPDEFIPIAENSGYITFITDWVFKEALRQMASWQEAGFNIGVSINLSARDILRNDFIDEVIQLASDGVFDSTQLMLEVTESAFVEDMQHALENLKRLYDAGFKLAMDDFGTGFSSLAQLKFMPVHELKIDKSFVLNLDTDEDDQKIVRSTIEMAHHLGLTVTAEGVENQNSLDMLSQMSCDAIQGYYLSRPISVEQMMALLDEFSAKDFLQASS